MENTYKKETTVDINGNAYKTVISLRDIEKMRDYIQEKNGQVCEYNKKCKEREKRYKTAGFLLGAFLITAAALSYRFFPVKGTDPFFSFNNICMCSLFFCALFVFYLSFCLSVTKKSRCHSDSFALTEELIQFLDKSDLSKGLYFDPDGFRKISAFDNNSRILEHFSVLGIRVLCHDQEHILIEGFSTGHSMDLDYRLRVVLPFPAYRAWVEHLEKKGK